MEKKVSVLILTKHTKHTADNSVYKLSTALVQLQGIAKLDIASISCSENQEFFETKSTRLFAHAVDSQFSYEKSRTTDVWLEKRVDAKDYDFIFLRLPPPLDVQWVNWLCTIVGQDSILNNPKAALAFGSKEGLLQFASLCPPLKLIEDLKTLRSFASQFPIVLKPLREHGGKGIVKVEHETVDLGDGTTVPVQKYWDSLNPLERKMLGMKFLQGVSKGDKRIVVCNGKVIVTALRKAAPGKWLCNVAQGGSVEKSVISSREQEIVAQVSKVLLEKGVVLFALDTLEDEGVRYLSEINCTSVGGIAPSEEMYGVNFTHIIAQELLKYMQLVSKSKK